MKEPGAIDGEAPKAPALITPNCWIEGRWGENWVGVNPLTPPLSSPTNMIPLLPMAKLIGEKSSAFTAAPPSPVAFGVPFPAIVVMMPSVVIMRTRLGNI
jgi:hypothetical protein